MYNCGDKESAGDDEEEMWEGRRTRAVPACVACVTGSTHKLPGGLHEVQPGRIGITVGGHVVGARG